MMQAIDPSIAFVVGIVLASIVWIGIGVWSCHPLREQDDQERACECQHGDELIWVPSLLGKTDEVLREQLAADPRRANLASLLKALDDRGAINLQGDAFLVKAKIALESVARTAEAAHG